MLKASLTYRDENGAHEIDLREGRITFGRGSEADRQLDDTGLSRLHASVYRENDRIWVVDENSTNGSFVNDERVAPAGTPLRDGDEIAIGNRTKLTVRITAEQRSAATPETSASRQVSTTSEPAQHFPLAIILGALAFGILVIGISAAVIGMQFIGEKKTEVVQDFEDEEPTETPDRSNRNASKSPGTESSATPTPGGGSTTEDLGNTSVVETRNDGTTVVLPKGRYQDMSESDKDRYIAIKAEKIARIIGNQKADPIPAEAVAIIKRDLNGYVGRLKNATNDNCNQGSWVRSDFVSVLNRATKTSPFVIRSFRAEGLEPQIGIYVAMIESEHCSCLTSNTGAKGMFQFLASTWRDYDPDNNPDNRCVPEKAAKAGAQYMKVLITRYGTAPDSVLLAIASFNSGQGNLSKNMDKVLSNAVGQNRSFWTLMANKAVMEGKSGDQFKGENIKYVPKFFACAIIGENPQDFGASIRPLSTYTQ
ncbi:MAG: FHA domain-containing protein [Acidobacteria bacterium]|nr:FHA domain-containing protein [Acidobacteriota bacterium]MBK8810138.1 FHA domain-containing protein [Acidobacteriota bacterium]